MAGSFVLEGFRARRARRACLSCRTRKIRCNVEQQGPPCSNCLTDGLPGCQTVESLRGKKLRASIEKPKSTKHPATASIPIEVVTTSCRDPTADSETSPLGRAQLSPRYTIEWFTDRENFSELQTTTPNAQGMLVLNAIFNDTLTRVPLPSSPDLSGLRCYQTWPRAACFDSFDGMRF